MTEDPIVLKIHGGEGADGGGGGEYFLMRG